LVACGFCRLRATSVAISVSAGEGRHAQQRGISFMATNFSEATGTSVGAPTPGAGVGSKKKRIRKIFGNIHEVVEMPNLIEVQRESYEQFLRSDRETGYVSGLEKTLRSVFPIRDFAGTAELDFVHYELEH